MPYIGAGIQRFNTADGLTVNGNAEVTGTSALTGAVTASGGATLSSSSSGEFNALTISQADNTSGNESRIRFKRTTDAGSDREVAAIVADRVGGNDTALVFETNTDGSDGATERVRINQDGKVAIGTSTAVGTLTTECTAGDSNFALTAYHPTSTSTRAIAKFQSNVGGTQEDKVTITCGGNVLVGRSAAGLTGTGCSFSANSNSFMGADNAAPLIMNRNNDDGTLMQFRQADNVEGSISVSGSTVSYNGGHLARFSQTTDGNRIDGLLKGTVMTNLDQMAVWSHAATEAVDAVIDADGNVITEAVEAKDAYTEDNEQLNCMAVSSVEGDINVAGVFVNWDDDDDEFTADMNVAMTGDMVIRIAQGTTVARGDLLMSAGDGTAKPQDDDIVRSKTIAKVTSTNVSHTYDDGSYLVPCVLMAC